MVTSSPRFSQVFILKLVKVLCFDTLLQVLILKALHFEGAEAFLFHSQAVPGVEKRPMGSAQTPRRATDCPEGRTPRCLGADLCM